MIRQNRAVPILLVLTLAFVLYLAGCFGSEEQTVASTEVPTPVVVSPTTAPVVTDDIDPDNVGEEPFYHTVEEGDRMGTIASKYSVTVDVILRANPSLNPNVLIVGDQLRIPGATTDNTVISNPGTERPDGVEVDYVVQSGDSLGAIADAYTVSLQALLDANPEVVPESLQVNQLLVIPPRGTGLSPEQIAARSTPVPVVRAPGEILEHTVAAGDLLSSIADTYGVSVEAIIAANGLADANQIVIGQILVIPPPPGGTDG